jgi:hypothetical protein
VYDTIMSYTRPTKRQGNLLVARPTWWPTSPVSDLPLNDGVRLPVQVRSVRVRRHFHSPGRQCSTIQHAFSSLPAPGRAGLSVMPACHELKTAHTAKTFLLTHSRAPPTSHSMSHFQIGKCAMPACYHSPNPRFNCLTTARRTRRVPTDSTTVSPYKIV